MSFLKVPRFTETFTALQKNGSMKPCDAGRDILLEIDSQGARQVREDISSGGSNLCPAAIAGGTGSAFKKPGSG